MEHGIAIDRLERAPDRENRGVREKPAVGVVENEPLGLDRWSHRLGNVEKREDRVPDSSPVGSEHEILESVRPAADLGIGGVLDASGRSDLVS
jgi:hypothetical protein